MSGYGRWLNDIQSEINKIFGGSFVPTKYLGNGSKNNKIERIREPYVDMTQDDENIKIIAEIPGLNKEDINLKVTDDSLEISAENKKEEETKDENWIKREIRYSKFYRQLGFPSKVIAEKAKAQYNNGVLELTIPKAEDTSTHDVKIE